MSRYFFHLRRGQVTALGQEGVELASIEDELEQHVNVRKAGLLSKGSYDVNSTKTLQAFYQSKGFNQVKVTPQFATKDSDVIVTFVVDEGPQDTVETFRVEGNSSVPLSQLAADGLRLAPDQPYSQKSIDDDRNKIMSYYLEHGYLTATFKPTAQPSANSRSNRRSGNACAASATPRSAAELEIAEARLIASSALSASRRSEPATLLPWETTSRSSR